MTGGINKIAHAEERSICTDANYFTDSSLSLRMTMKKNNKKAAQKAAFPLNI